MQSSSLILRRAALSASLRAPAPVAVRHISTSRALFDDSAKDSVKRAAKNTTGLAGSVGKKVVDTLKDVGDAAKEIFADGRGEAKNTKDEAKKMVSDRISGKHKATPNK